jgi:hypothetical protein
MEEDISCTWAQYAVKHEHKGGFAGSVWAYQSYFLAFIE